MSASLSFAKQSESSALSTMSTLSALNILSALNELDYKLTPRIPAIRGIIPQIRIVEKLIELSQKEDNIDKTRQDRKVRETKSCRTDGQMDR
ncbi:MAG: hypothetical protein EZS28_008720 [Streblomastix strix]|uniref:Uncharacterized protein n=1 Tax=Streblomastix strix TaxID=222440 RepID=A0A5J4WLD2_9EUKA|nr:MAG: hypothetical protein EZS28_008720 [Streblomastix strix]